MISIIYPNRCASCGNIIAHNAYFCLDCKPETAEFEIDDGIINCCKYDGIAKDLILNAKFHGNGYAVSGAAKLLYDRLLEANSFSDIDMITYIPSRKTSIRERGYCLTKLMAKDIAALSGKPVLRLLNVSDYKISQKELSREDRKKNLKGVFSAVKYNFCDKRVLLIDDISTTGSTLNEAENVLHENGAKKVIKAVFAKTILKT
jgi:competence protein ComFC